MRRSRSAFTMVGLVLLFVVVGTAGAANRESVLYAFHGKDGNVPSSLMLGADGALYGTTVEGGKNSCFGQGCGVVFQLKRDSNGKWHETVLHNFAGTDGEYPNGVLVADKAGNLYGTTVYGGPNGCSGLGCGVAFELARGARGTWTYKILHLFFQQAGDGAQPYAGMIFDAQGNLYGTTSGGGNISPCVNEGGCGVVFELTPNGKGNWTETVPYAFSGSDGGGPMGSVTFDSSENLYGTTSYGGVSGGGTVFKLTPEKNGKWGEQALHSFSFDTRDGYEPTYGVIFDTSGNIYGTTQFGGMAGQQGWGTAFKLAPTESGRWKETILRTFDRDKGPGGGFVSSGLVLDAKGNLYGSTGAGGRCSNCGAVFRLTPRAKGKWAETVLESFGKPADGEGPGGGILFNPAGNLLGVANIGGYTGGSCGQEGCGVIYEVTP